MIKLILLFASLAYCDPSQQPLSTNNESIRVDNLDIWRRQMQNGRPTITGTPTFQQGANFGQAPNISTFSNAGQLKLPNSTLFSTGSITAKDINSWGTIYQNGSPVSTNTATPLWTLSGSNIYNNNSGNVTIGATSGLAGTDLTLTNASNAFVGMTTGTAAGQTMGYLTWGLTAGGQDLSLWAGLGKTLNLASNQRTSDLFIDKSGNVGIGTTGPGYALEVNGAIKSTATIVNSYNTTGVWVSTFTPFYTGFSAVPTTFKARWIRNGRTVTYTFITNAPGTSNATTFTTTLPFQAAYQALSVLCTSGYDNGTFLTTPGQLQTRLNSDTVDIYKNISAATWTNSGAKYCDFTIIYETNAD